MVKRDIRQVRQRLGLYKEVALGPLVAIEPIMREIHQCTRVGCAFPEGESAAMLVGTRSLHITSSKWGTCNYVSMGWLQQQDLEIQRSTWRLTPECEVSY